MMVKVLKTQLPEPQHETEDGHRAYYWLMWLSLGPQPVTVCLVAPVNFSNGEACDWAAYMGGAAADWREGSEVMRQIALNTARHGQKVAPEFAKFCFPALADIPYRK